LPRTLALLVSCEHAGRAVPAPYRGLFTGREGLLATHRAWDPGALELARAAAGALDAPLLHTTVTRLLVDANRSLARYHLPHRRAVEEAAARIVQGGHACLHLSVHTFAPLLGGKRRRADLALLYDPGRRGEAEFCRRLRKVLIDLLPSLRVRFNYPYRGVSDGLTTHLRRLYGEGVYRGVELEANQALRRRRGRWTAVKRSLGSSLQVLLLDFTGSRVDKERIIRDGREDPWAEE